MPLAEYPLSPRFGRMQHRSALPGNRTPRGPNRVESSDASDTAHGASRTPLASAANRDTLTALLGNSPGGHPLNEGHPVPQADRLAVPADERHTNITLAVSVDLLADHRHQGVDDH